jgi:hypothetical protein
VNRTALLALPVTGDASSVARPGWEENRRWTQFSVTSRAMASHGACGRGVPACFVVTSRAFTVSTRFWENDVYGAVSKAASHRIFTVSTRFWENDVYGAVSKAASHRIHALARAARMLAVIGAALRLRSGTDVDAAVHAQIGPSQLGSRRHAKVGLPGKARANRLRQILRGGAAV